MMGPLNQPLIAHGGLLTGGLPSLLILILILIFVVILSPASGLASPPSQAASSVALTISVTTGNISSVQIGWEGNAGSATPTTYTVNGVQRTWDYIKYNTQVNRLYMGGVSALTSAVSGITVTSMRVGGTTYTSCANNGSYFSCQKGNNAAPFSSSTPETKTVVLTLSIPAAAGTPSPTPDPSAYLSARALFPPVDIDESTIELSADAVSSTATLSWSWTAADATPVTNYEYRLNSSATGRIGPIATTADLSAEHVNLPFSSGGYNLAVQVRAEYTAPAAAALTVTVDGQTLDIPATETRYSRWSDPASIFVSSGAMPVTFAFPGAQGNTALLSTTATILLASGVSPARIESLSYVLVTVAWLALATIAAGLLYASTGMGMGGVYLAALVWLLIWSGLGPFLASIPYPQAYIPAVLLLIGGGIVAVKRGSI